MSPEETPIEDTGDVGFHGDDEAVDYSGTPGGDSPTIIDNTIVGLKPEDL